MKKRKLKVDDIEFGLIINGLVEFRNKLTRENQDTSPIDELLLKLIDKK